MSQITGRGSITPLENKPRAKCRKWKLRVRTGKRDFNNGRYQQISRNFTGTYREAQAALRSLVDEVENNQLRQRSRIHFGEYVDQWLSQRIKDVAHGTYQSDIHRSNVLRLHLEHARLDEITPEVVEEIYRKIMNGGTPSGKIPSGTYARDVAVKLHIILDQAVKDGLITSNPCSKISAPSSDTKEKQALTYSQFTGLIAKLNPEDPSQLAILLSLKTGIRRGEACGLSWGDIDIDTKTISITHAYDDGGNLKPPKTKAGIRVIPITDSVIADLQKRKKLLESEFAKARKKLHADTPTLEADTPVICNSLGERQLPHSVTYWWIRNRKELGFDGWTVHEMRHSFLSEMARRGVDVKTLQMIAGHAQYSTTMDIYTHISLEDKRRAFGVVDW